MKSEHCRERHKLAQKREAKQISFHEGTKEGSNDKEILTSLENSLELWLGSLSGTG